MPDSTFTTYPGVNAEQAKRKFFRYPHQMTKLPPLGTTYTFDAGSVLMQCIRRQNIARER